MASDPTPPPYDNTEQPDPPKNEKPTEVADQTAEPAAGPSKTPTNADEQPHIVVFVNLKRTKSSSTPYKSQRDAVMLSPSWTYDELVSFLSARLAKQKRILHLPEELKSKFVLYYTKQEGDKDPWLDSNSHNNVHIHDDHSWRAGKALLERNKDSFLMMAILPEDTGKDSSKDGKESTVGGGKKKKSCVVQ